MKGKLPVDIQTAFADLINWPFLNEPLWRWIILFGAFALFQFGWSGVLDLMK